MDKYKLYYSRTELAKLLGENPSAIRFWTEEFSVPVFPSRQGMNRYNKEGVDLLRKISYLLREKRLTIEGAKEYLAQDTRLEVDAHVEVLDRLKQLKEELVRLRASINKISSSQVASPFKEALKSNEPDYSEE